MTLKQKNVLNIFVSIIIAGAMILTSRVFADKETADTAMFALVAVWFVPCGYLFMSSLTQRNKCRNRGKVQSIGK